jgi:hypothetical protein
MPIHTVKQGEHLSGIAQHYGLSFNDTIWNHPNNAALKNKRKLPHVLMPGDQLFIPDKKLKEEPCNTGTVHRFRMAAQELKLRLALTDFDNEPIANTDCELEVEGAIFRLKSDGKGFVEAVIPATAQNGTLRVAALDLECPLKIGHLDPLDEDSGWRARLENLGYYAGGGDTDAEQLRYAIEEFQCDHKLSITGELDAATQAKLKESHGV